MASGRSVIFPIFPHLMQDKQELVSLCPPSRRPYGRWKLESMNIHVRLPELLAGQIFAARRRLGRRLQQEAWSRVHGYGPPRDLLTRLDANKSALVSNPVLQSVGGVSDPGAHRGGQTEDPGLALVHQLPHAGHHTPRGGTGSRRLSCRLFLCRRHTRLRASYTRVCFPRGSEACTEATGARSSER